jgi:ribonuclease R
VKEAEKCPRPTLGERTDLREIPLVTIDGADARDFDDAVYAEKDGEGWKLLVAIADVANYVKHNSPLDREAIKRGNSTYFPDRVVPMLPEALSNDLCSLKPHEDRACLAVWMWVGADGKMVKHQFVRGLMRSKHRLTYEQVQSAWDGKDASLAPILTPLYGAYKSLLAAREARGTLELDLPERKAELDEKGRIKSLSLRQRLDSHKLIEEFMILANVAAAEALEAKSLGTLYRVHEPPSMAKLEMLKPFLESMNINMPAGKNLRPATFRAILEQVADTPVSSLVSMVVLRSQSQAIYSPDNRGHFGLALSRYAHFTSPIRRYADLVVHRGLIRAYKLGEGGLSDDELADLQKIGEQISDTERRSAAAEQNAMDRYMALYMEKQVGAVFSGFINGVTRFGLFVELDETGADGLIPMNMLNDDRYDHDEKHHCLIGQRTGRTIKLGARARVRLAEANGLSGSLVFEPIEIASEFSAKKPKRTGKFAGKRDENKGRKDKSKRARR